MIGIIFAGNIEYCPYLDRYTNLIKKSNEAYEILYWNRDLLINNSEHKSRSFDYKMDNSKPKHLKIMDFLKYRNWLVKQIKKNRYKKIIVLETLSGILIKNYLTKKYGDNFILDIRDYSYESNKLFYKFESQIIKKSFFTCISSEGFKEFLPKKHEYIQAHNFNYSDITQKTNNLKKEKNYGESINIVWIGSVRYFNHQIKIINNFKNDKRFNLIFHGTGPDLDRLISYCNVNNVENIIFTGRYDNSKKESLLENADILHNSYDVNIGKEVLFAISNKYYDGLIYKIPQLVEYDTYKHCLVKKFKIGIGLDVESECFSDELYNYYFSIDEEVFNQVCENELRKILCEDKEYTQKIKEFLNC